jgi:uncharacterized protein YhdP
MSDLPKAFDAEVFRAQAHQLADQLADYLSQALRGGDAAGGTGAAPTGACRAGQRRI